MATEQDWLDADNHKIVLVDISYHDGTSLNTKYFSSYPYVQRYGESFINILGDSISSISYDDIVFDVSRITTKINSSKSIGNITLLNTEGEYDDMLGISNSWEGHTIKIYIGDPNWTRNQFILILEGVLDSLTAPEPHLLAINIRDKKEVLNVTTQEATLYYTSVTVDYLNGNSVGLYDKFPTIFSKKLYDTSGAYLDFDTSLGVIPSGTENTLVPICLGKVFNIEPVLVDSYNHVYQIHECPDNTNYGISEVTEVRANGVKLTGINDANLDKLVDNSLNGTGTTLTSVTITGNVIDCTGLTWTTGTYSRGVIRNITLDESRYVIGFTDADTVTVNTNATDQTATVAGWLTGHTYEGWLSTTAPTVDALQYEENLQAGCIRLLVHDQSTQITCDITGQAARTQYTSNAIVPGIISHSAAFIVEYLTLEKTSLAVVSTIDTDICPQTFSPTGSLPFTNTDSLGIYIKDESNVLNVITEVMASVGGYIRFERLCVLQIFRFVDPLFETSNLTLTEDLIVEKGLSITSIELPEKSINLGYMKNWTVQDKAAVAGSVLESDNLDFLDQLTTEYSNVIKYTGLTNTEYPLLTDSDLVGTLIYSSTDADTEANRRSVIRSKKRYINKIEAVASPFTLSIGDVITVLNSRYDFTYPGKKVIIIGLEEYPTDKRVILEVWG